MRSTPPTHESSRRSSWFNKFRCAFRGLRYGIQKQTSFYVHLPVAILAIAGGSFLKINQTEWCLIVLCIVSVIAAELFNSCLELVAKRITRQHDPEIGQALDIASSAVLTTSIGAACVGVIVFGNKLIPLFAG